MYIPVRVGAHRGEHKQTVAPHKQLQCLGLTSFERQDGVPLLVQRLGALVPHPALCARLVLHELARDSIVQLCRAMATSVAFSHELLAPLVGSTKHNRCEPTRIVPFAVPTAIWRSDAVSPSPSGAPGASTTTSAVTASASLALSPRKLSIVHTW